MLDEIKRRHERAEDDDNRDSWKLRHGLAAHNDRSKLIARVEALERLANLIKAQCDNVVFNIGQGQWKDDPEKQQSMKRLAEDFSGAIARTLKGIADA